MSYVVIVNQDMSVKEIIKEPTKEQQEKGFVVENLTDPEQFMMIDEQLYYIKKEVN